MPFDSVSVFTYEDGRSNSPLHRELRLVAEKYNAWSRLKYNDKGAGRDSKRQQSIHPAIESGVDTDDNTALAGSQVGQRTVGPRTECQAHGRHSAARRL